MDNINYWLKVAKQKNVKIEYVSKTPEVSICCNLVSIPQQDTAAFTISFMRNFVIKDDVIPSTTFPLLMDTFENTMRDIHDTFQEYSEPGHFVRVQGKWRDTFNCHRLFFIPEVTVASFIMTLFTRENVQTIKTRGVEEINLVVNTTKYEYDSKF